MDKRSLLFFLSLSLTLFVVNYLFTQWDHEKNKEWYAQQKVKKEQQAKRFQEEIAQKTAKASQLPLVEILLDPSATQAVAKGVRVEDTVLLFAWSTEVPKTVYVRKQESTETALPFELVKEKSSEGSLLVYTSGAAKPLRVYSLPELGSYTLQLFFPTKAEPLLGEYRDGHVNVPILKLAKLLPNEEPQPQLPEGNAIALFKFNESYYPVGIYHPESQIFIPIESVESVASNIQVVNPAPTEITTTKNEEAFYVIETPYQQLVFSNYGGALVEINLPFQTKENQKSVVREIGFDREMVENHPQNARFPAHAFYTPGENAGDAPVKHKVGALGGYYPLLRRDLIEAKPYKTVRVKPPYYALNIVSDYPEVAELVYQVKSFDKNSITFEALQPHRRITKTFSVVNDKGEAPYTLNLTVNVEGDSRGLWLTTGVPDVEWVSGGIAPALKFRITRQQKADVENLSLPQEALTVSSVSPDWICNSNGFLGLIIDPLTEIDSGYKAVNIPGALIPSRLVEIDQEYQRFKAADMPGYAMMLPLNSSGGVMQFRVFAGPFSDGVLKTIDATFSDPATGYNPDYIAAQSFHGWFAFISEPFAKFLFFLMNLFHQFTNSWALSIILLTVALRLLLYPLNAWSMKSMIKMQQIAPEVTALQEKHKKNPKQLQLEIANLYRERGVNPLSGCFPLLIQMPFLIGMFDLLKSTFELRGASFIPGWIDNLAAPDVLFSWHYPIFFIGTEFHLLPILLGVVMFIQQKMSSNMPKDPKLMTDQQRQQRVMGNMMTVLFAVMFYHVPSGLNIYWLSSMLLGILQQWWTTRSMKKAEGATKPVKVV